MAFPSGVDPEPSPRGGIRVIRYNGIAGPREFERLNWVIDITVVLRIAFVQMNNPVTRPATWSWLATNREALLERIPSEYRSVLAQLGDPFCSKEELEQFDSVFGTKLSAASGGALRVGRVRERIDDCTALRAAVGSQLASTLGVAQ